MSIAAYDQDRPSLLPPSLLGDPDHRTRSLGGIADSGARLTLTEIEAGADHYGRRFRFKIRATARIQRAKVAPMTTTSLSPAEPSLILAETRHAVLSQPPAGHAAPGVPVVIVMPLTESRICRAFADEHRLHATLAAAAHPIACISWRQLWTPEGKERFAPRVNAISRIIEEMGSRAASFHLAAIGNGALVALKWLSAQANASAAFKPDIQSLTLISPALEIFGRQPRTTLRDAPKNCCVIADAASNWHSARTLSHRLPNPPMFALADSTTRFQLSEQDRDASADILTDSVTFEGDWRLSWADWLHRVHRAQMA
ncbi:hypothetical protein SAMN04488036_101646 [Shimia haliotis]|uniref:Alpha/beta hydrolase n=2 Tax=Shimia haliotis TaxID=1280847 RepID=A0A1I4AYL7_9RHOB|nr:hypothetical protein SAMN04488036_101646 [Shimia haliotis]